jgi:hypothetical protein
MICGSITKNMTMTHTEAIASATVCIAPNFSNMGYSFCIAPCLAAPLTAPPFAPPFEWAL